jgi:predicted O-methyltransferase YrrM
MDFIGLKYRLAEENWVDIISPRVYKRTPINYLEIGTFYGANLLSVAGSYASHPDSKLYCIDPWEDYDEYPEYKGEHTTIYSGFTRNLETSGHKDRVTVCRGYSNNEIPKFQDNFFDIIYIDGNHENEYVLEDAVLSFRKLKKGGILIFDDYEYYFCKIGVDAFLSAYHKRIEKIGERDRQVFVRKLK